ncbi:MAG: oligosaccharide flippase family protein [Candidatus Pacebacteria bacterium]|nr:oligosaccharide flippase family protein [Candidatus Paceibacterota bacterium]MBP9780999.1 oligosaccharide flippase family protein [Candidatus Paceibacterota bacterium]
MVKKLLSLVHKEFSGITEAAFLLAGFAFLSQILGLIRDRSFAHVLGASGSLDVYYASFRIPDLMFNSVSTMVSITVLLPFVIDRLKGDENNTSVARAFLSQVFSGFLALMAVVSVILFVLMPDIAPFIAPGFDSAQMYELVLTSRVMLLSPIFLGLSNLFGTVTQLYRKFFVYALAPVLYNAGILAGIYFFYPSMGVIGLGIGVVIGAILHMLIQLPVLYSHSFAPAVVKSVDKKLLKEVVLLSLPRTLGLSLNSLALLVLIAIASMMDEGSISIFSFAYNLQAVPISIIGVSYSVAAFPTLAKAFSLGKLDEFRHSIMTSMRQIIFWSMPVIVLFVVLRAQIVRVILGTGRFTWDDTRLTAAALALFAFSVVAQSLIVLLTRGYYAAGRTNRPLVVNIVFTLSEILFAFGFLMLYDKVPFFAHFLDSLLRVDGIEGTRILMLPLGYACGIIANAFALWLMFRKDYFAETKTTIKRVGFESIAASFILGFVTYKALGFLDDIVDINTFWGIFLQGFVAGIIGLIAWAGILYLLKSRELAEVAQALHRKFWKQAVVVPDQNIAD